MTTKRTGGVNTRLLWLAVMASTTVSGCASLSQKEKGAVIGATAGGVAGGVIGRNNGSTAKGAILGAAVGGAIGAVIGHQMDQQAKQIEQHVAGAAVERVGEGIQVTFASGLLFDFDSDKIRSCGGRRQLQPGALRTSGPRDRRLPRVTRHRA